MVMAAATISACFFAVSLLLVADSAADNNNNPADALVALVNSNRTGLSTALADNAGLGCIALQYIKAYEGQCKYVSSDGKKPANSEFTETFAPNCGVDAKTLTPITGRLLGCQGKYIDPAKAFSTLLVPNANSLDILHNKNHTQVGAAISGTDGGSPFFWCLLFSSGKENDTFVLENDVAKTVRPGCFSGTNDECSGSSKLRYGFSLSTATFFVAMAFAFRF